MMLSDVACYRWAGPSWVGVGLGGRSQRPPCTSDDLPDSQLGCGRRATVAVCARAEVSCICSTAIWSGGARRADGPASCAKKCSRRPGARAMMRRLSPPHFGRAA